MIVLEATGGFELLSVAALISAGLPVVVVNPRQVRDFARATGQVAKTDRIDADILALFAERVRPEVRPPGDDAVQELDALLARRRQLLDMLQSEKNRLGQVFGRGHARVTKSLKTHISYLERELKMADNDLGTMVRESPAWRERDDLLQSVPGVGPNESALMHRCRHTSAPDSLTFRTVANVISASCALASDDRSEATGGTSARQLHTIVRKRSQNIVSAHRAAATRQRAIAALARDE